MYKLLSVFIVVAAISVHCRSPPRIKPPETQLKMVYVMFRHGDRTPVPYELEFVPNNPHVNNTFEPFGKGQLMNKGKLRMFKRGAALRSRYDNFLGEIAYPDIVKVYCTSAYRVQATSLAFLSGLWPPAEELKWGENHKPKLGQLWSPIAYSLSDIERPSTSYYKCPSFVEELENVNQKEEIKLKTSVYDSLLSTISEKLGKKITAGDIIDLVNLYRGLKSYGLSTPEWVDEHWQSMLDLLDLNSYLQVSNEQLRKMAGGVILSRLVNDTEAKIADEKEYKNTKMIVYAAHDASVMGLLGGLGGAGGFKKDGKDFFVDYPNYGATVIVEIHRHLPTGKYGFKVLYTNTLEPDFIELPMNDCGSPCLLDDFLKLRGNAIVNPEEFANLCNGHLPTES